MANPVRTVAIAEGEQRMIRTVLLSMLLLLLLLSGLGTLQIWNQRHILPNPSWQLVPQVAEAVAAGVKPKSLPAATPPIGDKGEARLGVPTRHASYAPQQPLPRWSGATKVSGVAVPSGLRLNAPTPPAADASRQVPAPNFWSELELRAATEGLRDDEFVDATGNTQGDAAKQKQAFSFPRPIAVTTGDVGARWIPPPPPASDTPTTSPPIPLLIADIVRSPTHASPADSVHRPALGSGGFSSDDLSLPTTEGQAPQEETTPEIRLDQAPVLAEVRPSVNEQQHQAAINQTAEAAASGEVVVTQTDPPSTTARSSSPESSAAAESRSPRGADLPETPRAHSPAAPAGEPNAAGRRTVTPSEPSLQITRRMAQLQPRIDKVLRFYYDRPLNTLDDSAWSIMHSFLGYGVNTPVAVRGKNGRRTHAVGWICWNNPCAGRRLFDLVDGYIQGREGPGYQGHPGQFLAMLAQIRLKQDYPLRIQGKQFTVADLVEAEKRTCAVNRELTFKLIGLSHYLESDAEWQSATGESWNLSKILNIELSQPVNGAACGGTHRIMACSYAVKKREQRGQPLDGPYARAKKYVQDYHRYTMTLQNRDGSFSSDWFKRRANWGDKDRQLQTTGHILEWLVYSLPRDQLADPRIVRATEFLTNLMTQDRYHPWEVGPRGHALRALSLYRQRVFGAEELAAPMARRHPRRLR